MGPSGQNIDQQDQVPMQKMAEMLYWANFNDRDNVEIILEHEHDPNNEEYKKSISDISSKLQGLVGDSSLDNSENYFDSIKLVFLNPYTYVGKYTQEESEEFIIQLLSLQIITPEEQAQLTQQITEAYIAHRHVGRQVLRNVARVIGPNHDGYRKAFKIDTSRIIEDPNQAREAAERENIVRIEATKHYDEAIAELSDAINALRSAWNPSKYAARNNRPMIENAGHLMAYDAPDNVRLPDITTVNVPLVTQDDRHAINGTVVDPSFRSNIFGEFEEKQGFDSSVARINEKIWEAYYHLAKKRFNKDRKNDKYGFTTRFDTNIPIIDIIDELKDRLKDYITARETALKTALKEFNSNLDS